MRLPFFGKKNRNQWTDDNAAARMHYESMMQWSWEETRLHAPEYFERLRFSVAHAQGRVLEIGCGIGTMTRWLAASPGVTDILAVDAFPEAVVQLESLRLDKVRACVMNHTLADLAPGEHFDTIMMCEFLEHLYWKEERVMLRALRPHIDARTRYIVSTPVGFMPDPHHVRGFSPDEFRKHLEKHYGPPQEIDYASGYSQCAVGCFSEQ